MATLVSTRFGEIRYESQSVITFVKGLLGFEQMRRFLILQARKTDSAFKWLQSVEDANLAFLIFDPSEQFPNYWPRLPKEELGEIELDSLDRAIVACVVTVPRDPAKMTANFQSPLIINAQKRLAKQVVTGLPSYKIRQSLITTRTVKSEKIG